MTPQKQQFRHDPENGVYGDCYRACVASLLDLPIDDVPHVFNSPEQIANGGEEGDRQMDAFLAARGLARITLAVAIPDLAQWLDWFGKFNPNLYWMLCGSSPRGTNHVVICHGGKIIHDPAIDGGDITGPCDDGVYWVMFLGSGPMRG